MSVMDLVREIPIRRVGAEGATTVILIYSHSYVYDISLLTYNTDPVPRTCYINIVVKVSRCCSILKCVHVNTVDLIEQRSKDEGLTCLSWQYHTIPYPLVGG